MTRKIKCRECGGEGFNIKTDDDFQNVRVVCSECGHRTRAVDRYSARISPEEKSQ